MRTRNPVTRVPGSCLTQWTDCPIHAEPVHLTIAVPIDSVLARFQPIFNFSLDRLPSKRWAPSRRISVNTSCEVAAGTTILSSIWRTPLPSWAVSVIQRPNQGDAAILNTPSTTFGYISAPIRYDRWTKLISRSSTMTQGCMTVSAGCTRSIGSATVLVRPEQRPGCRPCPSRECERKRPSREPVRRFFARTSRSDTRLPAPPMPLRTPKPQPIALPVASERIRCVGDASTRRVVHGRTPFS